MVECGFHGSRHGEWGDIRVVPPMSYLQFLRLQSEATLMITDSGGVQEETTAMGIPCLTVRENTERPITLTEGTNLLVGLDGRRLVEEALKVLRGKGKKGRIPKLWDGRASSRIVQTLADHSTSQHAAKQADLQPIAVGVEVTEHLHI
jgi:UDP-N-acetylglucosamine 2-epimerase